MVDDSHIVFQNSNTAYMHMTGLTDTEFICLEHTLIVLRNNFRIPIQTDQNTYHQNPDFAESANSILRVSDILIK